MKKAAVTPVLFVAALVLAAALRLDAQVTTYTWTGADGDADPFASGNWEEDVAPPRYDVTSARLQFGNTSATYLEYYELYAQKLEISGNKLRYYFYGDSDSLHLGAGGLTYNPGSTITSIIEDHIALETSQTWNIASGTLLIDGTITDSLNGNNLTKTGAGTLDLRGADSASSSYSWIGGVTLSGGKVIAEAVQGTYGPEASGALGGGTLTFDGGTLESTSSTYYYGDADQKLILGNNVVSHGLISVANRVPTVFDNYGESYSTVSLEADTTISARGYSLEIASNITENAAGRKLTINSAAPVILTGNNSYTGGTDVQHGLLIFGSANAIPANYNHDNTKITVAASGYAGFGDDSYTNSAQAYFLNNFDQAKTLGSVGFDTDPDLSTPTTFTGNVNLAGFAATARLGSATRAILGSTATITPQGANYRFGGGGGWLQVDSNLTDGDGVRAVVLDSPAERPLTLRLTSGSNSYSGGTSVTNSAVIFGVGASNLSSAPTGTSNITINAGGYAGFERPGSTTDQAWIDGSLAHVNPASVGMVGLDVVPESNGSLSNSTTVNLGSFTNALYLGTASPGYMSEGWIPGFTLTGPIVTTNSGADPYRLGGYKGGWLRVDSTLSGTAGVKIGDPNSPATFGDPLTETYSTVELRGDNATLSGNVTLYGGQLAVSQANGSLGTDATSALGTGALVVQGMTLPSDWTDADNTAPNPKLVSMMSGLRVGNDITLNTTLDVGGDDNLTFSGTLSGTGGLRVTDGIDLTLSHSNTFSGGLYLTDNSSVQLGDDHAAGTGVLGFGGTSESEVWFNTANPVIGGLSSKDWYDYATLYTAQPAAVLTINQSTDTQFFGEFRSDDSGQAMRIVKNGTGTLDLDYGGFYFYHGTPEASLAGTPEIGLQVNQGTVILSQDWYLESSTPKIWVHGGTLALNSATVSNPVIVDNGGKLAGFGYFSPSGGVAIGTGATIAPGFAGKSEIGALGFNHLELNSGGTYEWHVASTDNNAALGHDYVLVDDSSGRTETLVLNATSADRFTLKVISLTLAGTAGSLSGFNSSQGYSWDILGFDLLQGGFDPTKFAIDTSGFANSLNGGFFSLSLVGDEATGGQLVLNFTPVPEPSTYALMALGLATTAFAAWRKRRRA